MASTLPDKLRAVLEANPSDAELAAEVRSLLERADAAKRRPRFKRADDVPAIKPSDRDLAILDAVRTHRCLYSHQITRLLADRWNEHETLRRLGPLFHHGYLDRPANQRHLFPAEQTSWPLVYALGPMGAALLAEHATERASSAERVGDAPARPAGRPACAGRPSEWTAKNRTIQADGHRGLRHTLLIAEAMIRIEVECRSEPNLRFIGADEIIARIPPKGRRPGSTYPVAWRTNVIEQGRRVAAKIEPDGLFGLEFLDRPDNRRFKYFVLEVDCGGRSQEPTKNWRKSIAHKLERYHSSWRRSEAGSEPPLFGLPNWRVLTITTGEKRMENMIAVSQHVTGGTAARVFAFAHEELLTQHGMLALPWKNGRGEEVRLGD